MFSKNLKLPRTQNKDRQWLRNYRPVSILEKFCKGDCVKAIFSTFIENNLSKKYSKIDPGDPCINQLLSINYKIFQVDDS